MRYLIFITICIIGVANSALVKLVPTLFTPCRPENSECLKNSLKSLVPHLKIGIPEYGIRSIEPLTFPDFNQSDPTSPVMPYTISLTKIQFGGGSDFEVPKLTVDLDKLKLDLVIFFPKLIMKSYEIVQVKGYGFEADGEGPVTETYNNITVSLSLKGQRYSKNILQQHVKWSEDLIKVCMGQADFEVDPTFTNGEAYQQILNKGSTEYPYLFNPEIEVFVKNSVGSFILESLNKVHDLFPIDVLYAFGK